MSYLPLPVSQSLKNSQQIPMSLNEVTIVFVKFQGLEKLPFDRMNLALRCVQHAVYKNDGVLRQFLLDDKGSVAVIVVGFPPNPVKDKEKKGININHHYEGSQDYSSAIKYYEDASIDEYTDGNYRDAVLNFSNLIRLAKKKKKVCKDTKLFKTVKSSTLCICTWLGYFAASECHVLHFHNSLKLLDKAMDILSLHSICNSAMFFCSRMAQRTRLIQQIKSMQVKVKSYLRDKIVKNKSLDMRGMEQEIFEDFPPLGWKSVELERMATSQLENVLNLN
eukprot:g6589.t1